MQGPKPCPPGTYSKGVECDGTGFEDTQACEPCTACVAGTYVTGTPCDGEGIADTQTCKTCATCKEGEYIAGAPCDGLGSKDSQICAKCTECPEEIDGARSVSAGKCDGTGFSDQVCWSYSAVAGESCDTVCTKLDLECAPPKIVINNSLSKSGLESVAREFHMSCDEVKNVVEESPADAKIAPFLQIPPWDTPSSFEPFQGTGLCLFSTQGAVAPKKNDCALKKASAVRICLCKPEEPAAAPPPDASANCADAEGWVDPISKQATCADWADYKPCADSWEGYSPASVVQAKCRKTCGLCS